MATLILALFVSVAGASTCAHVEQLLAAGVPSHVVLTVLQRDGKTLTAEDLRCLSDNLPPAELTAFEARARTLGILDAPHAAKVDPRVLELDAKALEAVQYALLGPDSDEFLADASQLIDAYVNQSSGAHVDLPSVNVVVSSTGSAAPADGWWLAADALMGRSNSLFGKQEGARYPEAYAEAMLVCSTLHDAVLVRLRTADGLEAARLSLEESRRQLETGAIRPELAAIVAYVEGWSALQTEGAPAAMDVWLGGVQAAETRRGELPPRERETWRRAQRPLYRLVELLLRQTDDPRWFQARELRRGRNVLDALRPDCSSGLACMASITELQAALDPGHGFLWFEMSPGEPGHAVLVTRGGLVEIPLSMDGTETQIWVAEVAGALHEPDGKVPAGASAALYERLLQPVLDKVKVKHLIFVPSGPVAQLPLELLVTSDPGRGGARRFLGESMPVTYAFSASSYVAERKANVAVSRRFVGVADPIASTAPVRKAQESTLRGLTLNLDAGAPVDLPGTREELKHAAAAYRGKGVATVELVGERGTRSALTEALRTPTSHLLLATHGRIGGAWTTAEPALLLYPEASEPDGLLALDDVARLNVKGTLVVLSACTSGVGSTDALELIESLPSAFLAAGARGVIGSSWRVDDAETLKFMAHLNAALAEDRPPDEALLIARRAYLAESVERDPRAWAAFQYYGVAGRWDPSLTPMPAVREVKRAEVPVRVAFVPITPGKFTMGARPPDVEPNKNAPPHEVKLTRAFSIGRTEVTQGEFTAVMGFNPTDCDYGCADENPVVGVSWLDAVAFCNKLSEREGLRRAYVINGEAVTWDRTANGYRLPTEAEWEYAARANTHTFRAGSDRLSDVAWRLADGFWTIETKNAYGQVSGERTSAHVRAVATKAPNAWGLYDLQGNVSEWVWDWKAPYPSSAQVDPAGPPAGTERVLRGGGLTTFDEALTVYSRSSEEPSRGYTPIGFRIAR